MTRSTQDENTAESLWQELIRDIPDFPKPGIVFKDITPLLANHSAFHAVVEALASRGRDAEGRPAVDKVVGIEARGFILAAPVALALDAGFVPVRKLGKLPSSTHQVSYALEYGEETLEVHQDALAEGDRVLIVDDVLATGGTVAATADLVRNCGASVAHVAVLLELSFLNGRTQAGGLDLTALITV
ncbi:MAG: adenine phosphoribosyltransferase [Propionibacteriales bacterium]|nr:adenine phosphoribosyltransferase [Propionibacteriales bacterium]